MPADSWIGNHVAARLAPSASLAPDLAKLLEQAAANLEATGDDLWVRLKAGDVHRILADAGRAEAQYRDVFARADGSWERGGAVERL